MVTYPTFLEMLRIRSIKAKLRFRVVSDNGGASEMANRHLSVLHLNALHRHQHQLAPRSRLVRRYPHRIHPVS